MRQNIAARLTSLLMAVVMAVGLLPVFSTDAQAANADERREALVSYAMSQDGKNGSDYGFHDNWCVWFVEHCALENNMGNIFGVNRVRSNTVFARKFLENNTGDVYHFKETTAAADYKVKTFLEADKNITDFSRMHEVQRPCNPQRGDIIYFRWKGTDERYTFSHVGIVTYVKNGWIHYVSGNASSDSTPETRKVVKDASISVNDKQVVCYARPDYHKAGEPLPLTLTWNEYSKQSIGTTNAVLARTLKVSGASIHSVSQVGVKLYNSQGSQLAYKTEKPNSQNGVINMWYDVNSELKYKLSSGTAYKYQFQAVINGKTHYSPMYTFSTKGAAPAKVELTWSPYKEQSIGSTNAVLARTLQVKNARISDVSQVGIRLYDQSGSLIAQKMEKPKTQNGVINMWYNVNTELGKTLTSGTYYEYQFRAVINGTTHSSPVYNFTTTGRPPHVHDYSGVWQYDRDSHWHQCSCGDKADLAAHDYGSWVVSQPATETTDGVRVRACQVCDYEEFQTIPAGVLIDEINFPDPKFRAYVETLAGAEDGVFTKAEIDAITKIDCAGLEIQDLTGIEKFRALTELDCGEKLLMDDSLGSLIIYGWKDNYLKKLDVSSNTALTSLKCDANQLTELDVSYNTELTSLNCGRNQLKELNVGYNSKLKVLDCYSNELTSLDLSHNPYLVELDVSGNVLSELDVRKQTQLVDLSISDVALAAIDLSQNIKLETLFCDNSGLTELDISYNPELTTLYCKGNKLTRLNLGYNPKLMTLECESNQLTELNLSRNQELFQLRCAYNQLPELDLSRNSKLDQLECNDNLLSALDLSHAPELTRLNCASNQLTSLDLRNNTVLEELDCLGNQLTTLNLTNNTVLKQLSCFDNQLTSLDLRNNTALEELDCSYNQLTSLDLNSNTALKNVLCKMNQLTELKVTPNSPLDEQIAEQYQYKDWEHWHIRASGEFGRDFHTWGAWEVTEEPTETTEGTRVHNCVYCHCEHTEKIPVLEHQHKFGSDWKSNETGHWHECSCGEKADLDFHTWGDWTVDQGVKTRACTVCGYEETAAAPTSGTITDVGRSLSLEGEIHINQYAKITGFEGVDIEKDGGLLIWNSLVTEENATFETADVNKPGLQASSSGYSQETDGIASARYADTLYLRIYVRNPDGTYTYGPLKEYSVRTYCESRISKNTSIKDTCVALLHYGAASQLYFNYNIDDLANKNIVQDHPSKEWDPSYLTPLLEAESTLTASDLVRSKGKSLSLEGSILVNFYFSTDIENVKSAELLVWESNAAPLSEENVSYRTALTQDGSMYRAESQDFVSCYYGKTIFACAKFVDQAGNANYSEVVAYSPETYAANKISQNTNPELVDTVKKMVMFGEEAQKYFHV